MILLFGLAFTLLGRMTSFMVISMKSADIVSVCSTNWSPRLFRNLSFVSRCRPNVSSQSVCLPALLLSHTLPRVVQSSIRERKYVLFLRNAGGLGYGEAISYLMGWLAASEPANRLESAISSSQSPVVLQRTAA